MLTKVQKWGNSLGVRIPKSFAAEAHVSEGAAVDISVENGNVVLKPIAMPYYRLDDLLSDVNASNIHDEVSTGNSVGNEAW